LLTRGQLRWQHTALHPDVYARKGTDPTLTVRTQAAWLWARGGILTGPAAASSAPNGSATTRSLSSTHLPPRRASARRNHRVGRPLPRSAGHPVATGSRLRLLLIGAGFPRPTTQIEVRDGGSTAFILDRVRAAFSRRGHMDTARSA